MEKKFKFKDIWILLKQTFKEWNDDDAFGKAAAVAYYAVFSLPGLLLITVTIVGLFFDDSSTTGAITAELQNMLGKDSAESIAKILVNINLKDQSLLMSIVGVGTLIFGATGLFIQLQKSLNAIWEVQKKEGAGIKALLKDRATSLGIVVAIAFLLLLSLVLSTAISSLSSWLTKNISDNFVVLANIGNVVLSIGIISLLFAAMFKVLPDVEIKWNMVWLGSIITSILFTIGKTLIGIYLSKTDPGATFGAAGAIILFLLWISYSSLIVFFGAEFTQVFGRKYGYRIEPSDHATYTAEYKMREKSNEQDTIT